MPTGTVALTFAADEAKMRWREPYVTEGLNRKFNRIVPRGLYAGFTLEPHGSAMTVNVGADSSSAHLAVYSTTTGYSLTIRKTGGDFTISLAAFPSQTVVIALYAMYATLNTTTSDIRVYTEAQYNAATEKDEILVLGKVVVPAAGVIPTANITGLLRDVPQDNMLPGGQVWAPLIQNGSFEAGPAEIIHTTTPTNSVVVPAASGFYATGYSKLLPNWQAYMTLSVNQVRVAVTDIDPYTDGGEKHLSVKIANVGAATFSGFLLRPDMFRAPTPNERPFRVKFAYKSPTAPTSGALTVWALFCDDDVVGSTSVGVQLGTLDLSASASWKTFEISANAPAGYRFLTGIFIFSGNLANPMVPVINTLNYTAAGVYEEVLLFDDFQAHIEFNSRWADDDLEALTAQRIVLDAASPIANLSLDKVVMLPLLASQDWFGTDRVALEVKSDADPATTVSGIAAVRSRGFVGLSTGARPIFAAFVNNGPLTRAPVLSGSSPAVQPDALPQFVQYTGDNTLRGWSLAVGAYLNAAASWAVGSPVGTLGGANDSAYILDFGGIALTSAANGQGLRIRRRSNPAAGTWLDAAWSSTSIYLPIKPDNTATYAANDMLGYMPCGLRVGELIAGGTNSELTPRVDIQMTNSTPTWSKAFQMRDENASRFMHFDMNVGNGWALVNGAHWNETTSLWTADDPGTLLATRVLWNELAGTLSIHAVDTSLAATWAEGDWPNIGSSGELEVDLLDGLNSKLTLRNYQTTNTDDGAKLVVFGYGGNSFVKSSSDPANSRVWTAASAAPPLAAGAANSVEPNATYMSNIVKAYASLDFNGGGNVQVYEAFGITALAVSGSGVRVTFEHAFKSMNRIAVSGMDTSGNSGRALRAQFVSTTQIDLFIFDTTTGLDVTLWGSTQRFTFMVTGDLA